MSVKLFQDKTNIESVSVRVSLEEKEMRVFTTALALALTLTLFQYPERDLNPHNRYGHRILSPACLPFHHPGKILSCSRAVMQSCGLAVLRSCSLADML